MEKLLELARRRHRRPGGYPLVPLVPMDRLEPEDAPRALALLEAAGDGAGDDLPATGLPAAWNRGIRTFYDLLHGPAGPRVCVGSACRFAPGPVSRSAGLRGSGHAAPGAAEAMCLGRCYEAPATTLTPAGPIPRRCLAAEPVVLRHLLARANGSVAAGAVAAAGDPAAFWADYDLPPGAEILEAVEASGLRGRGGAAYPTAAKWKVARDTAAEARREGRDDDCYVVANGDEGDPGAYIDRLLLEEAPHSVLAGMVACARAIGARRGVVYIRGEYPAAAASVRKALAEAEARGVLGDLRIAVVSGAGSYVAGEETALLRSIEGLRAEPSPKPPYPAERGLHGLPTVVQNVETLSIIPWVAARRRRADTKAVCVAGAVAAPGVVEVDLGTPLRRVLEEGCGGPRGSGAADACGGAGLWKMALVGGPLGRVVGAADFDVPLSFEALPGMGHAGVVVFDETVSVRALAEHLFDFARRESCGTCAPCRIGSSQLSSRTTRPDLERLMRTMEEGSLCGFGQGVARPIRDLLALFGDEVLKADGRTR